MSSRQSKKFIRVYDRQMLRSAFLTLFASIVEKRRATKRFTLQQMADSLGIHKSAVSRWFASPPNWTIDSLADIADALEVDLIVHARDRTDGSVLDAGAPPIGRILGSRDLSPQTKAAEPWRKIESLQLTTTLSAMRA